MSDDRRHVVLIGMAGVGKTAVGARLARRLGWPWIDLDVMVEQLEGCSVAEVFSARGESAFRALEAQALRDALAKPRSVVISTGGGVVLSDDNVAHLEHGAVVVWLRARQDTIVERLSRSHTVRPLLEGDLAATVAVMLEDRTHRYQACANLTVDVDSISVQQCVERVADAIAGRSIVHTDAGAL